MGAVPIYLSSANHNDEFMKRINRNPEKFEVIGLFDTVGRKRGFTIGNANSQQQFLKGISESLSKNKDNPVIIHGHRIEAMFEYVMASLGKCVLIKQEDAGEVSSSEPHVQPPDYRIVLEDGYELFVEVKNCHKTASSYRYPFRKSYIDALKRYASTFKKDLKIAVYWSRWNQWTLVSIDQVHVHKGRPSISMVEATKINEMALLGDVAVGTTPPLVLRLLTDVSKPRTVDESGHVKFTIGGVEVFCKGTRIDERAEKGLALYFILYGGWPCAEPKSKIEAGEFEAIDIEVRPHESTPGQGFELLGSLSSMISRRYNQLTVSKRGVERLSPSAEPGSLGVVIPSDYKGKQLPLWRFVLKPNENTRESQA